MGRKYQKRLTSEQDGAQFRGIGAGQFPHWAGKMGNVPSVPEFPSDYETFNCVFGLFCNPLVTDTVAGIVSPQIGGTFEGSSVIPISADQAVAIQTAITLSTINPPNYSIMAPRPACDCGTWAQQMLGAGGVPSGPPAWNPTTLMGQLP